MKNLEEKEYNNIYAIPANYTDSGKIFGGMLELRNTIEAALIVIIIGYPELMLIPMANYPSYCSNDCDAYSRCSNCVDGYRWQFPVSVRRTYDPIFHQPEKSAFQKGGIPL